MRQRKKCDKDKWILENLAAAPKLWDHRVKSQAVGDSIGGGPVVVVGHVGQVVGGGCLGGRGGRRVGGERREWRGGWWRDVRV